MIQPLQIVPVIPSWLPPAVVLIGMEFIFIWLVQKEFFPSVIGSVNISETEKKYLLAALVTGTLATSMPLIKIFDLRAPFMILLFTLGQTIEGVAALRFYKRVGQWIHSNNSGSTGGLLKSQLRKLQYKFRYRVLTFFAILLSISIAIGVLLAFGIDMRPFRLFALIWTIGTLIISIFGLNWKLRDIEDQLSKNARLGLILAVAGAANFGFATLSVEIVAQICGAIGYTIGFWYGAIHLITQYRSQSVAWLRSRVSI